MKKLLLPVLAILLLVSCGPAQPQYETRYSYVPPATQHGQACVQQCMFMKQQGEQFCYATQQQCQLTDQHSAQMEYQQYVQEQRRGGFPVMRSVQDFEYGRCEATLGGCMKSAQDNYAACYSSCGGQVMPQTVCVGNCNTGAAPR